MCGRFTLTTPAEVLAEAFGLDETPELEARYNVAPTQEVAAVGRRAPGAPRRLSFLRWGLVVPGRAGRPLINARAETLWRRPAFRDAVAHRRCLVPADGFYEWKADPGRARKRAFHIRRPDGGPIAFAGLWELPVQRGERATCALVTTEPNAVLRPIHDRMPVILPPEAWEAWLDPTLTDPAALQGLLVPYPDAGLAAFAVGPRVNDPRFDGPECLAPA